MELTRQIGSLFIIGFGGTEVRPESEISREIEQHGLGGVILFSRRLTDQGRGGNIESPEQLRRLTTVLQALSPEPLLICVDQEGGRVQRLASTHGFFDLPSAKEMAAMAADTSATLRSAEQTASLLAAMGINVSFSPVVDLDLEPDNPIIGRLGRSFSADPTAVAAHAAAWIKAHRRAGVLTCLKHFPGHGSSRNDSHLGFVDISESWRADELVPYRTLISKHLVDMVMVGHLFNRTVDPDVPATLSPATIGGLLRNELGYDGAVVSDDLQMQAITDHYRFDEAICRAIAAGIDLLVIGNNIFYHQNLIGDAVAAVLRGIRKGIVSEEQVVSAWRRVQHLKHRLTGQIT